MTPLRFVALLLGIAFSSASVQAFDSRLQVNPDVSLANLSASPGMVMASSGRGGNVYWADASAVLDANPARLFAAAQDYDRYVEFGMPYLNESHVVERATSERMFTWASMSYMFLDSSHYLEVRIIPAVNKQGGRGMEWQLARKKASWKYPENSAFNTSDGSFFIQPLTNGKIYVRYYLSNDVDVPLGWTVSRLIQRKLRQGAANVIGALGRQAVKR